MKKLSFDSTNSGSVRRQGFSLIEVVLAIGIFLVTVLALVGLLGPTLQSVDEVEKTDEIASVVNTVNAFLQSSPEIAPGASKFDAIYNAVANNGYATILVFRQYDTNDDISLQVGFVGETSATVDNSDIRSGGAVLAAGTIYRVVLTPSSVIPDDHLNDGGAGTYPRYTLKKALTGADPYPEGYFAMEIRIYAEDPGLSFDVGNLPNGDPATPASLVGVEPMFTYNTAVVR
jgi:Tfp pilus assembly protein PilV